MHTQRNNKTASILCVQRKTKKPTLAHVGTQKVERKKSTTKITTRQQISFVHASVNFFEDDFSDRMKSSEFFFRNELWSFDDMRGGGKFGSALIMQLSLKNWKLFFHLCFAKLEVSFQQIFRYMKKHENIAKTFRCKPTQLQALVKNFEHSCSLHISLKFGREKWWLRGRRIGRGRENEICNFPFRTALKSFSWISTGRKYKKRSKEKSFYAHKTFMNENLFSLSAIWFT